MNKFFSNSGVDRKILIVYGAHYKCPHSRGWKKKICIQKLESAIFYRDWYACKMSKKITRNGERKQQQLSYLSRVEKLESHFHLNRRLSPYQVNLCYLHSPPKFQSLKLEFSLIEFFFQFQRTKKKEKRQEYIYTGLVYTLIFSKSRGCGRITRRTRHSRRYEVALPRWETESFVGVRPESLIR